MRQFTPYILTALLLLGLGSCKSDVLRPEAAESGEAGSRTMTLTVAAPDADPGLRAHLAGKAGDTVLKATFEEGDDIALFVWQEGKLYDLANVTFASIEQGGKRATLTFDLPAGVDATKAIDLIGYDGPCDFGYESGSTVKRDRMVIQGDRILISAIPYGPVLLDQFDAPVMFHEKGIIPSEAERTGRVVKFKHFGCYEVISFTNNSSEEIEPHVALSRKGRYKYGATRSWAYDSALDTDYSMKYPVINLTEGRLFYHKERDPYQAFARIGKLAPGATATVVSWYVPNAEVKLPEMQLAFKHNMKWTASEETIPAKDFAMEIGKAYVTSGAWDGTKVTLGAVEIIEPTAITLDRTEVTIKAGKTATLTPTIEPADATNKTVTWSSSDDAVATVTEGVVTGHKAGTAAITAETANGLKATAVVTVEEIPVTKVTLSQTEAQMTIGGELTLKAAIEPDDATHTHLSWTSSDSAVATVDANGKVTARSAGTATITATAVGGAKAACVVTVSDEVIEVTGVTLDKDAATIEAGKSLRLTAAIEPANATNVRLEWSSSDTDVAIVTDGLVQGIAPGKAIVTVKTANGKTASCIITVEAAKGVPDVPGVEL